MSQREKVLRMLKDAGPEGVRSDEFIAAYMPRAAARIKELRDQGYEITSEPEKQFVRYRLAGVGTSAGRERPGQPGCVSGGWDSRPSGADWGEKLKKRFMEKVEVLDPDGCWFWLGHLNKDGYGQFWRDGKDVFAHRTAYELFVGPFPAGLVSDHLCRNRLCVNPAHIEPVTSGENVRRGDSGPGKFQSNTHCPKGHLLSGDNLRINEKGHRECFECRRAKRRAEYRKRKVADATSGGALSERSVPSMFDYDADWEDAA